MPRIDSLTDLQAALAQFSAERDWDQFHSPKNLAMAIATETGELLEHFRWLSEAESAALDAETRETVALEIADVLLFLARLSSRLEIDMLDAARRKLALNAAKYPVEKSRGRATKYTKL